MSRYERSLWILLVLSALASCVGAPFPRQMYLQHLPTVVVIIALPVVARRWGLSAAAFTCIIAFMLLHVLGARYIYSYVPYDEWTKRLVGISLTEQFGFVRNHYDRLVHFGFGLLFVRPVWDVITGRFEVPPRFGYYASVEFVLAFSLIYELFEWSLTLVLSPQDAGAYNGQQGDIWDAHRDMAGAFVGALLALVLWRLSGRFTSGRARAARRAPAGS